MSEHNPPPEKPYNTHLTNDHDGEGHSASSAFLELMRSEAARQHPPEPPQEQPRIESQPTPPTHSTTPNTEAIHQRRAVARERLQFERVQRRRMRRRQRTVGVIGGFLRPLLIVGITAMLTATIFTWWQGPEFLSPELRDDLSMALATATRRGIVVQATPLPSTPNWLRRVGIVSGHRGPENDPGAVCPDGLTEAEINFNVAQRVVRNLQSRGYTVDLLDEFDPRLSEYQAELLLSIHANTCQDYGEIVSGYLISTADARAGSGNDALLVECVAAHYRQASQLNRRYGLTRDMTDYHIFRQITPRTPAAIIELGFMFSDRDVLTQDPDMLARGITNGILCYLEPGDPNILATLQAPPPSATATPEPDNT